MFATIQLDLTVIGRIIRENPYLAKKVDFRDGLQHQLLSITVSTRKEPDRNGNDLAVSCRPKDAPKDNKWFIGNGREWKEKYNNTPASQQASAPAQTSDDGSLPF